MLGATAVWHKQVRWSVQEDGGQQQADELPARLQIHSVQAGGSGNL